MEDGSALSQGHVVLEGEYDLTRKQELASLFASLDGADPIEIDLSRVTYLDSTVLHELIALRARRKDGTITLAAPNPNIRRIFELTHLDQLFQITELDR